MLQETHVRPTTGLQSFAEASPDYMLAPVGLGSFQRQAQKLAEYGRNGDIYVVHAAEGETVIPVEVLDANPKVRALLFNQMREMGVDPNEYVVGDELNSINPATGLPEFFFKSVFKSIGKAAKKVFKVAKKVAPIVLPLALSAFGVPYLGTAFPAMFGQASLGAAFLGSGIGTLIGGGGLKDALKSGLMSAATAGLTKGLYSAASPGGFSLDSLKGTPSTWGELGSVLSGSGNVSSLWSAGEPKAGWLEQFPVYPDALGQSNPLGIHQPVLPNAVRVEGDQSLITGGLGTDVASDIGTLSDGTYAMGFGGLDSPNTTAGTGAGTPTPTGDGVTMSLLDAPPGTITAQPGPTPLMRADPFAVGGRGAGLVPSSDAIPQLGVSRLDLLRRKLDPEPEWYEVWKSPKTFTMGEIEQGAVEHGINIRDIPEKDIETWLKKTNPGWLERNRLPLAGAGAAGYVFKDKLFGVDDEDPGLSEEQLAQLNAARGNEFWDVADLPREVGEDYDAWDTRNRENKWEIRKKRGYIMGDIPSPYTALVASGGLMQSGARGGFPRRELLIEGPGTERSDDIPAMLSDGEFVMNASAVRGADPTGRGNRHAGARNLYNIMRNFEMRA